eukprot:gene13396-9219_t
MKPISFFNFKFLPFIIILGDQISALLGLVAESDAVQKCPLVTFAKAIRHITRKDFNNEEHINLEEALTKLSITLSSEIDAIRERRETLTRTCDSLRAELSRAENQLRQQETREKEARELQAVCNAAVEVYFSAVMSPATAPTTAQDTHQKCDFGDEGAEDNNAPEPGAVAQGLSRTPFQKIRSPSAHLASGPCDHAETVEHLTQSLIRLMASKDIQESTAASAIEALEVSMNGSANLTNEDFTGFSQALVALIDRLPLLPPRLQIISFNLIGNVFRRNGSSVEHEKHMWGDVLENLVNKGHLIQALIQLLQSVNENVKCEALEYLAPLAGAPHLLPMDMVNSKLVRCSRETFIQYHGLEPLMDIVLGSTSEAVLERALVLLWGLLSRDDVSSDSGSVSLRSRITELGGLQVLDLLFTDSLAILENVSMVIGYITRDDLAKKQIRSIGGLEKIVATLWHPCDSIKTKMAGALWNCASITENRTILRDLGAIPILLNLLETDSGDLRQDIGEFASENAAGALWHLSLDPDSKTHILVYGGIKSLVSITKQSGSVGVVENVTGTLWNCSASAESRAIIRRDHGLPVLLSLLNPSAEKRKYTPTPKVMDNVAGALRNCAIDDKNKIAIKEAGGLLVLLALLQQEELGNSCLAPSTVDKIVSALWILTISPDIKGAMQVCGGCEVVLRLLESSSPLLASGTAGFSFLSAGHQKPSAWEETLKGMHYKEPRIVITMIIREKLVGVIRNCCTLQDNRSLLLRNNAVRVLVGTLWDCFTRYSTFRPVNSNVKRKTSSEYGAPSPQLCETVASALWHLSRVSKSIPLQQGGLDALCYLISCCRSIPVVLEQTAGALSSLTAGQKENCEVVMDLGGLDSLLHLIEVDELDLFSSAHHPDDATRIAAMFHALLAIRNSTTSSEKVISYVLTYAEQKDFAFSNALINVLLSSTEDCVREAAFIIKNLCTSEKLRLYFSAERVKSRLQFLSQTSSSNALRRACLSTLKSLDNSRRLASWGLTQPFMYLLMMKRRLCPEQGTYEYGARHCRLLEALLDAADLNISSEVDPIRGPIPPVVLPQGTEKGCEKVFEYLEYLQRYLPSIISRPLRSPIEECIQSWELSFLTGMAFGEPSNIVTSSDALRKLLDGNAHSLDLVLEVAMLSDFLMIESLTDLTCAFLASLGLSANSETDLLRLWGSLSMQKCLSYALRSPVELYSNIVMIGLILTGEEAHRDGSGSSRMRDDDEQSIASTAGPPPDSPPITGRFNSTSWAHMGESCPSGGSSLTNSFSVQFHSGQNNNFRPSLQRMNSSIFLYSGYHPSQSVASISASPTMNGSPGREWGRSFIVRPTSSSVQGRGYRSAFGGTIRNGVELERSTFLPQRQGSPCSTQYGWGFASQEACRASLVFSSTSPGFTAPGSPLHSPAASYYYGHTQRAKVSPADLPSSLSALKNYIAVNGKTIIVGDESHPLEIKRGGVLGSGGFAKVFIGLDTVKGELLAIKEMSTENITDVHTLNEIEQEFALLRSIRHPNVINYHFFEHSKSQKVCRIAMELLAGNSTMHLLQRFGPLTETILRKITRHLLNAISFVHKEGIFHRDIKPANILVSHTGNVKLCDFGCSKRVSELSKASSCIIGTPIYMAPELIKRTPHQKSDIWSMGCTLFELATGLQPWYHTGVKAYIPLTFYITTTSESPLVLPEEDHLTEFSPEFLNFLNLCFCRDVQKRPEATELLRHPWITEKKMIPAQRLSPELSQPGSPHSYNPNDTKMSESSPDESKYEDELTHEEDERRAETETMCQQELEDVCATIALDRCYQLMNYRYPPAVEFKAADGVSETTRTSCSTPTPSLGKPMTNSIFDFAGGEGSPEQSLLNDDFVFQHAPLGISAGNFVLPTEISETPMQQCLRINENGKLEFANLPEEEGDVGEMANFRSISVDSNVFSRSHNSRFVSPGRKASLHGNNGATQMPTESPHGSSYVSRGSSPYRGQGDGQSGGRNSGSPSPPPFFTQGSTSSRSGQQPYGSIRDDFNQASAPHSPFPVSAKKLPDSSQVDGKLYTSFCVNAASGHEVNVELEVDMNDVHLRMVNNQPNYLVAFNENIKSQITNKLKEVAAQADADHLESARSSSKRYNGQPGSIDGSHRHPSPISTRRTSQNLSFYSNDARSRENVGSEADAPVRSSVSPQRKMPPSILTQSLLHAFLELALLLLNNPFLLYLFFYIFRCLNNNK